MQHLKTKQYGPVKAFELGYHWPGLPTFTVHIYYIDGLLIDTGQYNCRHTVLSLFKQLPLQQIALTHWHEDHIGNVSTLYNHFHPTIFADPLTSEKVRQGFDIMLYEKYFFGKIRPQDIPIKSLPEEIKTSKYSFVPIYTPGHSDDHHVYLEPNEGWLFSGDLFVSQRIKVFRKGENIWQQIDSLKRVLALDFDKVFCAHNPQIEFGRKSLERKLDYFESFTEQVCFWYNQGYKTAEIIQKMALKDKKMINLMTGYDVSVHWMVGSVIKHLPVSL